MHDYLTYGTAHVIVLLLSDVTWAKSDEHNHISRVKNWFELHPTLTPEVMTTPFYGFVDFAGWF